MPASVIVSAPPPAQDPAPTTPIAKGAGLGPQAPDSQATPAPAPQVEEPVSLCPSSEQPRPCVPSPCSLSLLSGCPACLSVLLAWETALPWLPSYFLRVS